jgi:hypothetical protein
MATQTQLKLRDPRHKRPVMTMGAAKGILDVSEDEILAMIDERLALIAFDVATPGSERRELRILTHSVAEFLHDNPDNDPCYHTMTPPSEALRLVLPSHSKPFFTGIELQRAFNCSSDHIISLIEAKALKLVPGSRYQPGPGGSPCITRESVVAFLKARLEIPVFPTTQKDGVSC